MCRTNSGNNTEVAIGSEVKFGGKPEFEIANLKGCVCEGCEKEGLS